MLLARNAHLSVPIHKFLGELVQLCVGENILHKLWKDGFELFEGG
jgi:hypothetical protein